MSVNKVSSEKEVISALSKLIEEVANDAIEKRSHFRLGLSGGSLIKYLVAGLPATTTDWSKWQLFFCDERFVPEADEDSTFGAYKKDLIPKTPLKEDQFVVINLSLSLDDCAKDYEKKILSAFNVKESEIPCFDLLLLGMGPDGHTCSLFPGHALLNENKQLIAPISDSPKPPPERVTMTYPLINNARRCVFAMSGAGKADMLKKIFVEKEILPAALVRSKDGSAEWILDNDAGLHLP